MDKGWFTGRESLLEQARRQVIAAQTLTNSGETAKVVWILSDQTVVNTLKEVFKNEKINIEVRFQA